MTRQCAANNIAKLLEKMESPDKDYRFIAINNMLTQLQKDRVKLDEDSEGKVVRTLLKLLEDKHREVQNLAVKCLALLIIKVKPLRVQPIIENLCCKMLSDNEPLRDIFNIGLKTIISQFPLPSLHLTNTVNEYIINQLIVAIQKENVLIQLEALDVLVDMLQRFGSGLPSKFMVNISNTVLPKLRSSRQAVRQRAIVVCSLLTLYCDDLLYKNIAHYLFQGLAKNLAENNQTYIQCIAAICCQSGKRFGNQIERFFPLISACCREDNDDDTREYCLFVLQAFIKRCPKEITPYVDMIIEICLQYLGYDPNYNYEEDQDYNMNDSKEMVEDSDQHDDDLSWRVRRGSVKCLEAIISSRHELLPKFYQNLASALITRFKGERDENVKSDVFQAMICLIKQTESSKDVRTQISSEEEPIHLLQLQVPALVNAICSQMMKKSIKTRQGCFQLLKVLCNILPDALTAYIGDLIPGIRYSLQGTNSTGAMKIEALSFLNCLLTTHQPEAFHPHINAILSPVLGAVKCEIYKTAAEALIVLRELIKVMSPLDTVSSFDYTSFVNKIYDSTLERVKVSDTEVKDQAILTMGQIRSTFGDYL